MQTVAFSYTLHCIIHEHNIMIIYNIINFIYIVSKNEFALERLITQKDTIYFIYFLKNKSKISKN